jgi:hypothetical protein
MKNLHDRFLEMEELEDLFSFRLSDGTYYWDIIRLGIFENLTITTSGASIFSNEFMNETLSNISRMKKDSIGVFQSFLNGIKIFVRLSLNTLSQRYLIERKPNYLFFTYQKGQQIPKDHICDDLVELLSEESICVEFLNKSAISYKNMVCGRKTRVPPVFVCKKQLNNDEIYEVAAKVSTIIKKYFSVSIDVYDSILNSILVFNENRKYYFQLFSKFQPKAIIGTNGGSLKGLYAAASEKCIPTIEIQHGTYGSRSIFHSYPKYLSSLHPGLAMPTIELTFSDYWNDISNFPVKFVTSIGNDNFYQEKIAGGGDILIVSNFMYHELLIDLVLELSDLLKEEKIYYKLHPQQFKNKDKIIRQCKGKDNVEVISEELSQLELFERCNHVVGIRSTLLYIALQAGKNVYIYKRINYDSAQEVKKYMIIFDNVKELEASIKNTSKMHNNINNETPDFFVRFDEQKFLQILENAGNYV